MTIFCRICNVNAENVRAVVLKPITVESISIKSAIISCDVIPGERKHVVFQKKKFALYVLVKVNVEYIKGTSNIC